MTALTWSELELPSICLVHQYPITQVYVRLFPDWDIQTEMTRKSNQHQGSFKPSSEYKILKHVDFEDRCLDAVLMHLEKSKQSCAEK